MLVPGLRGGAFSICRQICVTSFKNGGDIFFQIRAEEGNLFASIQAFIRRCKDLLEICYSNSQLYR